MILDIVQLDHVKFSACMYVYFALKLHFKCLTLMVGFYYYKLNDCDCMFLECMAIFGKIA